MNDLIATARALVADHKGLLAMDESTGTCDRRFAAVGIPQTPEMRRAYRDMLVGTPGLGESISGAILFDETIRQQTLDGRPFVRALADAGIIAGIKVDAGAHDLAGFPGEKVTEGLDGLRGRLAEYVRLGARFAKWRAVIALGNGLPSGACLHANAHALARYAALCQEAGVVPIVEPEVLTDGATTLERCAAVTEETLHVVFRHLHDQRVQLEGMVLKPNMVLTSFDHPHQASVEAVADATVRCLLRTVPAAVAGVAFLSGGQPSDLATARLNAMNARYRDQLPWPVTFSFARALQQDALETWRGRRDRVAAARAALASRAVANRMARSGELDAVTP